MLLIVGVIAVGVGVRGWRDSDLSVPLHVAGSIISFFGSVVALARFRRELTKARLSGGYVQRPLQGLGLNTGVALVSWLCGILQVALIGLQYSAQFAG